MQFEYLIFNLFIAIPILFIAYIRPYNLRVFKISSGTKAILLAAFIFIIFDSFVTGFFWYFNSKYILGLYVYRLPIEEIMFFFSVPFACLFLWENFKNNTVINKNIHTIIIYGTIFIFSLLGLYSSYKNILYTAAVSFMIIIVLVIDLILKTNVLQRKKTYVFLSVINILTFIFNYYLTARPVVIYNILMKTNIQLFTIPLEDFLFGTALLTLTVILYEKLR